MNKKSRSFAGNSSIHPFKFPKVPKGWADMKNEEGASYNDIKKAIKETNGVADIFKTAPPVSNVGGDDARS